MVPTLKLRIETFQVNPPKPGGICVFNGDTLAGVVSLEDFKSCAEQLEKLERKRADHDVAFGITKIDRPTAIAMRNACASIAHNYGDRNDEAHVEVSADIERSILELDPEDAKW